VAADPPGDDRVPFGRDGEAHAEAALVRAGLRIVARRYRTRRGEIDLVAEEGDVLVFAEVKARRSERYGSPGEAVGWRKRRRIAGTALVYLAERALLDRVCRFDVVEILQEPGGEVRVTHHRDAFRIEPPGRRRR
jgi:putative endonuclease